MGTAFVIDAFFDVIGPGSSLICIASNAGSLTVVPLSPEVERHLALSPTEKRLDHPEVQGGLVDSGLAYLMSKKAKLLRVQASTKLWGSKGTRINSISPGIVMTRMGAAELEGPNGHHIRYQIDSSGAQRAGTPEDIASMAAFLAGPQASFITGSDFLVDGGIVPALRWNTSNDQ